jgi:Membrane-bound serine protease (ClpP class)
MIFWALFLLLLGILFFAVEIFVPGFGIFGAFSFISITASFFIIFIYVPYGFFVVAAQLILLIIASIILIHVIKKHKIINRLILSENLNDDKKINPDSFLNKVGITTTMLKPSGFVKFDNDTVEVYSQSGLIKPNVNVKVTQVYNKKIFVDKI